MRMAAPKLFSRATANTSFMLTRAGASDLLTRIFGLGTSAPNQALFLLNIVKNGDAVRLLRMSLRFMCHLPLGRNGTPKTPQRLESVAMLSRKKIDLQK